MILRKLMLPVEAIATTFEDLDPIEQDDGPEPVCVIQYPSSFTLAYNYLRAVWKAKEVNSQRALKLSATCLKLNPANYTVWHFRRQCLQAQWNGMNQQGQQENSSENVPMEESDGNMTDRLEEMIRDDLDLASSLGGDNPKNYQIWYHRRALLELLMKETSSTESSEPSSSSLSTLAKKFFTLELEYIADVLDEDSKNYHAWSHRQWLVKTMNDDDIWDKEKEYARQLLEEDPFNNSAWNQRWFVVHRGVPQSAITLDVAQQEADFALSPVFGASLDPYNESPWRYLIGILKEQQNQNEKSNNEKNMTLITNLITQCELRTREIATTLQEKHQRDPNTCSHLLAARIDMLEMMDNDESIKQAITLAQDLATKYDPIRHNYWLLRVDLLKSKTTTVLSS